MHQLPPSRPLSGDGGGGGATARCPGMQTRKVDAEEGRRPARGKLILTGTDKPGHRAQNLRSLNHSEPTKALPPRIHTYFAGQGSEFFLEVQTMSCPHLGQLLQEHDTS